MKKKPKLESEIQAKIRKNLIAKDWMVIKLIQTSTNGIPDLLIHRSGQTAYIEVKREGEKPTPLQLHRHSQLRAKGISVFVTSDENFSL